MKNFTEKPGNLTRDPIETHPFDDFENKVTILIVDDHPENLLALEAVLNCPSYHLVRAYSGEEALKQILQEDFAVILLDVQMPGLNGFDTAKLIKSREKSKHIPIIFITALSQAPEHVVHGYGVGAIDYIFKPFQPEVLRLKIEEFVRLHQQREQLKRQHWLLKKRSIELEEANKQLNRLTVDLRKSEELARAIEENSTDTILTFNDDGLILSANKAAITMFGYRPEELEGAFLPCLILSLESGNESERHNNNATLLLEHIRDSHTNKMVEAVALDRNNRKFPVEIQFGTIHIEDHLIHVCSIRDITERKQLETERKEQYSNLERLVQERTNDLYLANQNLQRTQERFQKIFNSSPCLISIRSMKSGKYIDVNESWIQLTEYLWKEIKNCTSDILRMKMNTGEESLEPVDYKDPIRNAKVKYYTKSGNIREGFLSSEMIEINGETCQLEVITDITERVLMEKEMARLDRLNLVGEMAAGIAHEIRNPMTTVRGFLQMSKVEPSTQYINLMLDELDRANSIITEFLNLAKNKTTDQKLQNLSDIVRVLFPLIQAEAMLSGKTIQLKLMECPDLYLDEKEIRQLILNLSLNGLEAMESGGELLISTKTKGQEVILAIQDQGSGIKPELLDKLGTPFFTTKERGTGLGLAVCYSIASRHHAGIKVNTSSKGTKFSIRFKIPGESN